MRAFELYVGITMASTISASNAPYPGKINNTVRRIDGALNPLCCVAVRAARGSRVRERTSRLCAAGMPRGG